MWAPSRGGADVHQPAGHARGTGRTPSPLRWIRIFTVALPLLWAVLYLTIQSPVIMVQIGGVTTGIFLVAVVFAVYYLRRTETDPRLHGGRGFAVALGVSSVAIGLLGVYTLLQVFGVTIG